jgi:membrane protease YdiL (CAAX protease family)
MKPTSSGGSFAPPSNLLLVWAVRLATGPAIYLLYRWVVGYIQTAVSPLTLLGYPILTIYGSSAVVLCCMFAVHCRLVQPASSILGIVTRRQWATGLGAVFASYAICIAVTLALGNGREPVMRFLGLGMTQAQYWWLIASLIVLPPIVEELGYRHFLLTAVPIELSKRLAAVAVFVTALMFWHAHSGYIYTPTKWLMFTLGLVLGWARVATRGLLLPISLHAFAEVVALSSDAVWKHW